jgi:hypothetical protein
MELEVADTTGEEAADSNIINGSRCPTFFFFKCMYTYIVLFGNIYLYIYIYIELGYGAMHSTDRLRSMN